MGRVDNFTYIMGHMARYLPLDIPASSDIWWPSLETCSDLLTSAHPISADVLWLLNHLWLVQVGSTHLTGMFSCFCLFFVLGELSLT